MSGIPSDTAGQNFPNGRTLAGEIGRAGLIVFIWSVADKVMAIAKEMLTAHRFGVSPEMDAFNVAMLLPGLLNLIFCAVLGSAFIPLYIEWRNTYPREEADSHASWMVYLHTLFFALLTGVSFLLIPLVLPLFGYGLAPADKQAGISMTRLLILLVFLEGAGIMLRGILHSRKMFFHLHLAPVFVNLALIFFLVADLGLGIYDLVTGFLVGTFLKTLYMTIALRREGFSFTTTIPFDPGKLQALWLLALPLLGSELIANANLVVDQVMATLLSSGSVSTLRYAFRINDLPIQVIIIAVARAIFPFISEEAARGNKENLRNIYKYTLIFLGFITIPVTSLVILFAEDLVRILLLRGAFDAQAAANTAEVLACYSLGLFFYAYTFVNGTYFAALKSTKTLLFLGFVSIFLNVFFNFLFMHLFGLKGIALSTSVTMAIISVWFITLLKKRLEMTDLSQIMPSLGRITLAGAGMTAAGYLSLEFFRIAGFGRLLAVSVTLPLVCFLYLGIVWLVRTRELKISLEESLRLFRSFKKTRDKADPFL